MVRVLRDGESDQRVLHGDGLTPEPQRRAPEPRNARFQIALRLGHGRPNHNSPRRLACLYVGRNPKALQQG